MNYISKWGGLNEKWRCIHLKIKPVVIPIVEKLHEAQKEFFYILTHNITKEEYKGMETVLNKMYANIIDQFDEWKKDRRKREDKMKLKHQIIKFS